MTTMTYLKFNFITFLNNNNKKKNKKNKFVYNALHQRRSQSALQR